MTARTFKQYGIAYGEQTANITAKIDNVVVYQGPVTTINETFPNLPNSSYTVTNELFSWTTDVAFSGPQVLEIALDGTATLLIANLTRNYNSMVDTETGNTVSTGPNGYVGFPYTSFGNTYINGNLRTLQPTLREELGGVWWWSLTDNGTFVENMTVEPGLDSTWP